MAHLFIYGTLCDQEVCEKVLGRPVPAHDMIPCHAPDFAVYKVAEVAYPCLLTKKGAVATGFLLTGLSEADLAKLDLFEGPNYTRTRLALICDKADMPSHSEYYKPHEALQTDGPWDFRKWQTQEKAAFLSQDFNLQGVRAPSHVT